MKTHVTSWLKAWFGDFDREELKKFLKLGIIFAFVVGVYWTLRPLKNSIFTSLVHPDNLPWAKLASLAMVFPMIIIYSKLVDKMARDKLFYVLGTLYALGMFAIGAAFMHPTIGLANTTIDATRILPWVWYVFTESYGSLMVALFWAFAADVVHPDSAKRGFPLVVMIGQLGSIFGPYFLTPLGKTVFGNSGPTVIICGLLMIPMMLGIYLFLKTTPKSQLSSYHGKNEETVEKQHEPGFLEGLFLMFKTPYLLGMFAIIMFTEIIVTIIDFHFQSLVYSSFASEVERTFYLGDFAVMVNLLTFLCLFFGVSNIQRRLGIKTSLVLVPLIIGGLVVLFWTYPVVKVLFWIMVGSKAIGYALNGPALKQLYIPTTKEVRYKSQAWIEAFGSRGSKAAGSGFNLLKKPFQCWYGAVQGVEYLVRFGAMLSGALLLIWLGVAVYLGKTYQKAVDNDKVVC